MLHNTRLITTVPTRILINCHRYLKHFGCTPRESHQYFYMRQDRGISGLDGAGCRLHVLNSVWRPVVMMEE